MKRVFAVAVCVWLPASVAAQTDERSACRCRARRPRRSCGRPRSSRRRGSGVGITHSHQYTLSDGTRTARAVWKTIDESKPGVTNFQGGGFVVDFADSSKHEVASYELDKLVGTGLVPPTVERTFARTTGSLQLWVEKAMTEADRKQKRIEPPDIEAWNRQIYGVRLLHQLTFNTDAKNIRNVLSDPTFRVYAVDFSRAVTTYDDLRAEKELVRFSRD